jgi:hypothetical protein
MSNSEQADKLYHEWKKANIKWPYHYDDLISFGAFCIEAEANKFMALEKMSNNLWWAEMQRILLVNFLKMPIESQKELLKEIKERRPDIIK